MTLKPLVLVLLIAASAAAFASQETSLDANKAAIVQAVLDYAEGITAASLPG